MTQRVLVLFVLAVSLLVAAPRAQEDAASMRQQALEALAQQIRDNESALSAAQAVSPRDTQRIEELQKADSQLRDRLAALASGTDVAQIRSPKQQSYELQEEVMRLLKPLVRALSEATEAPRQIQELNAQREKVSAQLEDAEHVVRGLQDTIREQEARSAPAVVRDELTLSLQRWQKFAASLKEELVVLGAQMDALERTRAPVAETVQNAVASFVRRRGVSILLAVAAAAAVVYLLRATHRVLARAVAKSRRQLPLRLFEVAFQALAVVGAAFSVVLVFYLRGDFELLALVLVFLLGVGWALSRSLPSLLEQLRLLFNAGSVREGERVLVDNLPFRVDALRLYSRLSNPDLQGANLRVPLRDLVGKSSRRAAPDEPWFPTPAGDWALLAGGAWGHVESATPETVVVRVDGSPRHYRTTDYLALQPTNLSKGFRLEVSFGIDYRHQVDATSSIPERLAAALRDRLPQEPGGSAVESIDVEFQQAAASSLDLLAVVRCAGAAAPHYSGLRRAVMAALVDASTKLSLSIPFPQLTVHRAGS